MERVRGSVALQSNYECQKPTSFDIVLSQGKVAEDATSRSYIVSHIVLHELDQERSLRQAVNEFFKNAKEGSTLLVQCDPLATSKRRIEVIFIWSTH
jgi:hypothetical protein